MYYTKFVFKRTNKTSVLFGEDDEDDEDLLEGYATLLCKNGQIYVGHELVSKNNEFMLFATMPEKDSLDDKYNNRFVTAHLNRVRERFNIYHKIIGISISYADVCKCKTQEWYMLYSIASGSPIRCGNCRKSVPLYRFPVISIDEFITTDLLDTVMWQKACQATDLLWMFCVSDRFTYRQMNNPESSLMKIGKQLCEIYESLMEKPFYLYLFQYYKTRKVCPICGADWTCKDKGAIVAYKCDICKLVADKADLEG